jgi:Cu-Zn family superoxide dismutase
MHKLSYLALALFAILFAVASPSAAKTKVELRDAQGKSVGNIIIWDQGPGVALELHLHDLTPGDHGIHFHAVPKCEAPDFKSAGGHFNPENKKHGFDSPDGHHAGDMTNFTVNADGKAEVRLEDKDVTLKDGPHSLFGKDGAAIVVHAKADDYKTDPSGNSGDRVACGVIAKEEVFAKSVRQFRQSAAGVVERLRLLAKGEAHLTRSIAGVAIET